MSYIAGIDFSSHAIDIVRIDEDESHRAEWCHYPLKGNDAFDRARNVRSVILGGIFDDVMAIGIEDPRGQNAGALYRVQGAILCRLGPKTLVYPWVPSQWRKAVGLKGNCSKKDIYEFVAGEHRPGWMQVFPGVWNGASSATALMWPQDACDAYCIALATRQAIHVGAAA